jgi:hypothetical protein
MARQPEDTMTRDLLFFSSHRSDDGSLTEVGHTLMLSGTRSGKGAGVIFPAALPVEVRHTPTRSGMGAGAPLPCALSIEALHTLLGNTRVAPASHDDTDDACTDRS